MENQFQRGEIYLADLSNSINSEQRGVRPVVIVSNAFINQYSPTVTVAAISSKQKRLELPTHVPIKQDAGTGLRYESIVMLEQLRTISKSRFFSHKIGKVDAVTLQLIDQALLVSMGIGLFGNIDVRVLCSRCLKDYLSTDAFWIQRSDPFDSITHPCCICGSPHGRSYSLLRKVKQ